MADNAADVMIDRRRMRRKVTFWRAAFLVLALIALLLVGVFKGFFSGMSSPHIAKVKIDGIITLDDELLRRLSKIASNPSVEGVIIEVNSPGGTTVGGETIFKAVRKIADKKPVVSTVGNLSASAGYMISSAADHIVAYETSMLGSIGVLFQYPDISVLLDKVGVKVETIKSTPLKAEPNFFSPASEEAKSMIRSMIMDTYDWFVDLVQERRNFTKQEALALADGAVFTGRQALKNGLIDELGGDAEARKWLISRGVGSDLPIIEWEPESSSSGFSARDLVLKMAVKYLGLPDFSSFGLSESAKDLIFLDGMVSVMQVDNRSHSE